LPLFNIGVISRPGAARPRADRDGITPVPPGLAWIIHENGLMPAVAEHLQPICIYVTLSSHVLDFEQEAAEATEKLFSVLSGFLLFKFMNNSG
jgi:hypothetical protein